MFCGDMISFPMEFSTCLMLHCNKLHCWSMQAMRPDVIEQLYWPGSSKKLSTMPSSWKSYIMMIARSVSHLLGTTVSLTQRTWMVGTMMRERAWQNSVTKFTTKRSLHTLHQMLNWPSAGKKLKSVFVNAQLLKEAMGYHLMSIRLKRTTSQVRKLSFVLVHMPTHPSFQSPVHIYINIQCVLPVWILFVKVICYQYTVDAHCAISDHPDKQVYTLLTNIPWEIMATELVVLPMVGTELSEAQ